MTPYTADSLDCLKCPVAAGTIESHCSSKVGAAHKLANDGHTPLIPSANLACLGLNLLRLTVRLVFVRKLSKVQSFHVIELSN